MASNGEKRPEQRETHKIEKAPPKDPTAVMRDLGNKAINGPQNDKNKK